MVDLIALAQVKRDLEMIRTEIGTVKKLGHANAKLQKAIASVVNEQEVLLAQQRADITDLKAKNQILEAQIKSVEAKLPKEVKP